MTANAIESASHRQVGLLEAVQLGLKGYVRFSGRSSRGAYWYWVLAIIILGAIASVIDRALLPLEPGASPAAFTPVSSILGILTFLPGIAVGVRRLHDIGRSGWWILIVLIPVIGILVLIYWACQPGQRHDNAFGADREAGRD